MRYEGESTWKSGKYSRCKWSTLLNSAEMNDEVSKLTRGFQCMEALGI